MGVRCHLAQLATKPETEEERRYWQAFLEEVLAAWAASVDADPPRVPLKLQPITLVMYAAALVPGGEFRAVVCGMERIDFRNDDGSLLEWRCGRRTVIVPQAGT